MLAKVVARRVLVALLSISRQNEPRERYSWVYITLFSEYTLSFHVTALAERDFAKRAEAATVRIDLPHEHPFFYPRLHPSKQCRYDMNVDDISSVFARDQACNECRRRKARCDKALPECGPCKRSEQTLSTSSEHRLIDYFKADGTAYMRGTAKRR